MEQPALLIADYLLAHRTQPFTPLHILKLTYICHGWSLGLYDKPLIKEDVEAWKYGPVIRSVYNAFRKYRANPITHLSSCSTDIEDVQGIEEWRKSMCTDLESDQIDVMNGVLDAYGDQSPSQLIGITHRSDSPWTQCYDEDNPNTPIPNYVTKSYYKALANGRIE